jgi:hypothetical protein
MTTPLTYDQIGPTIHGVLTALPDFRFSFRCVAADDHEVIVEARNEATVAGRPLTWRAAYCVSLRGDLVVRGRRTYDQHPIFAAAAAAAVPSTAAGAPAAAAALPAHPLAPDPAGPRVASDGDTAPTGATSATDATSPTDATDARSGFRDLRRRAASWAAGDARGLLALTGDLPLLGPGLDDAVRGDDRIHYLDRLFGLAGLRLDPGVTVGDAGAAYQEWDGTAHSGGRALPFRLVEGVRPGADGRPEWVVFFDTWHLVAASSDAAAPRQVHDLG